MKPPIPQITLNIRYDIPENEWNLIGNVYRSMDGWLDSQDLTHWYWDDKYPMYISASMEPGGIHFVGQVGANLWTSWLTFLCARLSIALGREIHDAEM